MKNDLSPTLVSAVIVVYNGALYIREALDSILSQTYSNIEVVVINDGSTDKTRSIVESYSGVRLINQENQGEGAARNRGIQEASGAYIAYLDADDQWAPTKIEKQINLINKSPENGFILCRVKSIHDGDIAHLPWVTETETVETVGAFYPSALFARKSLFSEVGFFVQECRASPDVDWFMRAQDIGIKHAIVEEALLYRRFHADNMTKQNTVMRKAVFDAVFASVKRKKDMNQ